MDTDTRRNGQAAVEFIIGLLVLVTLLAGGIQYLRVANAHRSITTTLRAEAGARALRDDVLVDIPPFLRDWEAGRDGIRHTEDVMLRVRLRDGLPVALLSQAERRRAAAVVDDGLATMQADRLVLTDRGRLLADAVVRAVLD